MQCISGQKQETNVSSLSEHKIHRTAAVMVSIKSVLEILVNNGKVKLNIISYLPISQYRKKKKIFYMIQQFPN